MTARMTKRGKPGASLEPLVGPPTYRVWVDMLKILVPGSRTHRLASIVAGMLRYATERAAGGSRRRASPGSVAEALVALTEGEDDEAMIDLLNATVERLFQDAGVRSTRHSHKGEQYSVVDASLHEFLRWSSMPWE